MLYVDMIRSYMWIYHKSEYIIISRIWQNSILIFARYDDIFSFMMINHDKLELCSSFFQPKSGHQTAPKRKKQTEVLKPVTSSWPCRIWDPGGFKLPDMEHVCWYIEKDSKDIIWLVVLTILKHIRQWEGLSHILWKKQMFETTNQ